MVKISELKVGDCIMHERLGQVFKITKIPKDIPHFSVQRIDKIDGGSYTVMPNEFNNFHKLGRLARLLYDK